MGTHVRLGGGGLAPSTRLRRRVPGRQDLPRARAQRHTRWRERHGHRRETFSRPAANHRRLWSRRRRRRRGRGRGRGRDRWPLTRRHARGDHSRRHGRVRDGGGGGVGRRGSWRCVLIDTSLRLLLNPNAPTRPPHAHATRQLPPIPSTRTPLAQRDCERTLQACLDAMLRCVVPPSHVVQEGTRPMHLVVMCTGGVRHLEHTGACAHAHAPAAQSSAQSGGVTP
jgi:hypothetical protein